MTGRQIDDEPTGLFLGKLIEFIRHIFQVWFVANFGAFQFQDCLARERQEVARE